MITLKNVLRINAISSAATGMGMIVFASTVASVIGVNDPVICYAVGIFLSVFGIFVFAEAIRQPINSSRVRIITTLDVSWVVGSLVVLLSPVEFTIIGRIAIIMVALWVAMMAFLQYRGLRMLAS
jgi:hypothetical protein